MSAAFRGHGVNARGLASVLRRKEAAPASHALEFLRNVSGTRPGGVALRAAIVIGVIGFVALGSVSPAHAGGFLDGFASTIQSSTGGWMNNSLMIGNVLFSIMMSVTFVTAIVRYAALNHTLEGFGHAFMDLFIKVIPLYVLMVGATSLLPNIVGVANELGGQITGVQVNGPSEIFAVGLNLCGNVLKAAISPLFMGSLTPGAGVAVTALTSAVAIVVVLVLMASFSVIAFEYFFAFAQAYINLSIGAFALGWSASGGTRHMAEQYLAGAWLSLMRIVVTIAVTALIVTTVPSMTALSNTSDLPTMAIAWLSLAGSSLFAVLLAVKLPDFASKLFSGQPAVSAPEVSNSVLRAGTMIARAAR